MQIEVKDKKLSILREGKSCKFKKRVQEKTFAGVSCNGRQILYVTERCVFKLIDTRRGPQVQLIEVAPGIRVQEDILDKMDFMPIVKDVKQMDSRCFFP